MGWHAASGQERTLFQEVGTGDWRWDDSPSTPDPKLYFTNVPISSPRSTRSSTPGWLMSKMRSGRLLSRARAKAAVSITLRLRAMTSRSEEHTSELQSLMRISYAVFCLKKKNYNTAQNTQAHITFPKN